MTCAFPVSLRPSCHRRIFRDVGHQLAGCQSMGLDSGDFGQSPSCSSSTRYPSASLTFKYGSLPATFFGDLFISSFLLLFRSQYLWLHFGLVIGLISYLKFCYWANFWHHSSWKCSSAHFTSLSFAFATILKYYCFCGLRYNKLYWNHRGITDSKAKNVLDLLWSDMSDISPKGKYRWCFYRRYQYQHYGDILPKYCP